MAYDGGYGHQQRPYAGYAAQPPTPRGGGFDGGPPPRQYDDYQDSYGHESYGAAPGPDYRVQYQDPGFGRADTQHGYINHPPPGRGGRPPTGGRGGHVDRPPTGDSHRSDHHYNDGYRSGKYPPRGRGGMAPGPGPGPGPAHGRGGGRPGAYPQNPDPSMNRRPPMNNGPQSPGDSSFGHYPAQGGRVDMYQEQHLTEQMSGMDLNNQRSRVPPNGRASSESPHSYGDYNRPPPNGGRAPAPRGYPPQGGYPDAGRRPPTAPPPAPAPAPAPGGYDGYGNDFGSASQGPPRNAYGPPTRSMTTPMNGYEPPRNNMPPPPQRMDTVPYQGQVGYAGHAVPQRPATTTGSRPTPHRTYPSEVQSSAQGRHGNNYDGRGQYGEQPVSSVDTGFDPYFDNPRLSNPEYGSQEQQRSSLPDFSATSVQKGRGSFDETMRTGYEQPQRGPHGTPQLHHTKSLADVHEPQSAVFEMAGDIPSVPPVPHVMPYQSQYDQHSGAGGYNQLPPRGPSAPPTAGNMQRPEMFNHPPMPRPTPAPSMSRPPPSQSADSLPSHPTPVRPGLMANSMVNMNNKPPPVRNYGGIQQMGPSSAHVDMPPPQQMQMQQQQSQPQLQQQPVRSNSVQKPPEPPVTPQELERLRMTVKSNPNDQESAVKLAKRLIEASNVLTPNIPDPKARARGRERYLVDAHKILKKLSNAQNVEAMFILADSVGRGLFGQEPDNKEAFTLYQSAAKLNHAAAAYRTAVCCEIGNEEGGGTRRDPLKAMQWYKRAATLGDPPAMYKVGMILLKGLLGQPRNPREAVTWLQRAAAVADTDNPHALHELGLLYESAGGNDTLVRDEGHAMDLFQQAANLGYKFSQFRLGCAYEYGLMGCPIDARMSIAWYSRAAKQAEHQSELALSGWYLTGSEGVIGQSDAEAFLWARKAAQAGLAKAEYAMGYFTETGIGTPPNLEDAKRWYWRAAAQDFPKARERLEDLKRAGKNVPPRARERISRSRIDKQQEGECSVM